MTQEDKELLLKDICARLPYEIKVSVDNKHWCDFHKDIPVKLTLDNTYRILLGVSLGYVKPYLFPLSSMTLEQRCKLRDLLPNNCDISFNNQKITFYDEGNIRLEQLEKIFHFFNLFHFDYRGLIPKGLALDATGLNIY